MNLNNIFLVNFILVAVFLNNKLVKSINFRHINEICSNDSCGRLEVPKLDDVFIEDIFSSRVKREFVPYPQGKILSAQVSAALDKLLLFSGYDKRIRPHVGGPPVPVTINLSIRSMGPVNENKEEFFLDCYFRQSWMDPRLKYNSTGGVSELALNWAFLEKIWVPDTFFINGKESYLHKITVPNRFVRISPKGRVSYSQRLTISAACPMNLKKYPLDSQMCPLYIGSFGYNSKEIAYQWAQPQSVSMDKLGMAQFHFKSYKSYELITTLMKRRTRESPLKFSNDSVAVLEFFFERQTGFFLLQIYTPLTLIVMCSWVTFWLVKTEKGGEVPARTVLGANSVLSVVNIGFGGKSRPQVGYMTALDLFIVICFVAVFAALIEFASIVFLDYLVKKRRELEKEKEEKEKLRLEKQATLVCPLALGIVPIVDATATVKPEDQTKNNLASNGADDDNDPTSKDEKANINVDNDEFEDIDDDEDDNVHIIFKKIEACTNFIYFKIESFLESRYGPFTETYLYKNTFEFIYSVDLYARKLFPAVFMFLMLIYWTVYLYIL